MSGREQAAAPPPAAGMRRAAAIALLVGLGVVLCAAALPRDTLWGVESTCILNSRTTGSPFPCIAVNLAKGTARGYAVLRAPFRRTHVVTMPTARVEGVEAPELRAPDAPDYFADAWDARRYVAEELDKPLGWDDAGLAVNSRATRSQDQLHIHVDCVLPRIKAALAALEARVPADAWLEAGLTFQGQSYWLRRVDSPSLEGVNPFALSAEIPALKDHPAMTTLAAIGIRLPAGGDGFMLLAGKSDPGLAARQSTSEDLLDHACRRLR